MAGTCKNQAGGNATRNCKNFDESNFQQDITFTSFHVASVFDDPDDKLGLMTKYGPGTS